MQYLIDTSICIFFLRGKPNLDEGEGSSKLFYL